MNNELKRQLDERRLSTARLALFAPLATSFWRGNPDKGATDHDYVLKTGTVV